MKRSLLLLFIGALWGSLTAQAAVVDKFRCRMEFNYTKETRGFETMLDLAAPRVALSSQPAPNVSVTESVTTASTVVDNERLQAAFALVNLHALKLNAAGQSVRAAQYTCLSNTVLQAKNGVSADCRPPCENPFDPKCRWTPVALNNGIAAFDTALLKPVVQNLSGGSLRISCVHGGTVE